jgi:hypothetical protein
MMECGKLNHRIGKRRLRIRSDPRVPVKIDQLTLVRLESVLLGRTT